jgi:tRNA pseudouridine55 synthase
MNGVLVVDKAAGPTSHDVVARARRALGIPRIGHTGTLDPLATGVLALVVGKATRLAQFLSADEKEYVAGVRLGGATRTYDAEERLIRDHDGRPAGLLPFPAVPDVTAQDVQGALAAFVGTFLQAPPPFSAKKIGGTPAYLMARLDKEVEVRPVPVTVRTLELVEYTAGLATVRIVSSSGFYVRSLAHDLGKRLGCGGHLESLRRMRSGDFTVDQGVPLETVQAEGANALSRLIPMGRLLPRLPQAIVNERGAGRVAHGNSLQAGDLLESPAQVADSAGPVRVLDRHGALLAVAEGRAGGTLHPLVVLV